MTLVKLIPQSKYRINMYSHIDFIVCRTDFIFHAVDPRTGEIIDFDTFIIRLDVDRFFEIVTVATCNPESISVSYNKWQQTVLCYSFFF